MNFHELPNQAYQTILDESMKVKPCPKCGSGKIDFITRTATFGASNVIVVCRDCHSTFGKPIKNDYMTSEKRIATPVTYGSFASTLWDVITAWNERRITEGGTP